MCEMKKEKNQIKSTDYYVFVVSLTANERRRKNKYEFMINATHKSLLLITNGKPTYMQT